MTDAPEAKHYPPFLDELADDVVLDAAVLTGPVTGPDAARKVVFAVAGSFASQAPAFHAQIDDREISEYEATLPGGQPLYGVVGITRNAEGKVTHIGSTIRPLGAVVAVAQAVRETLKNDLDPSLFI